MSVKKLALGFVVVFASSAIAASSAVAAVQTQAAEWYTGAAPGVTLVGDTAVTAELPSEGKFTLAGTIGGVAVEVRATGVECVGCQITNEEVTEKAGKVAIADGQFRFNGVTVVNPAGCVVHTAGVAGNGTILTKPLKIHADWMDTNAANQHAFLSIFPTTGAVFASLQFTDNPVCPIAGAFNVTGSLFGESENNTGVQAVAQPVVFSAAVQTTTGAALKLAGNPATLTGTAIFKNDGLIPFGIH